MLTANEYFDGNVRSIGFQASELPATVGVMAPGTYRFDTSKKETVTVIEGALTVKLPGASEWVQYDAGASFVVAANESFDLRVSRDTAYLCLYE